MGDLRKNEIVAVLDSEVTEPTTGAYSSKTVLVIAFSTALFTSALLLFSIQPLIGKALLPKLGGTPQVWNTCMVFFQTVVFAGYLHAHFTGIIAGLRKQAALHLGIAALALLTLPIAAATGTPDPAHPILWLLQALTVTVGAPLFVISATAPLLQKWFSHTRHPAARDPYFLYAASNLGSLLALLGYPTLVEPYVALSQQGLLWSIGFLALVALLGICFVFFWRDQTGSLAATDPQEGSRGAVAVTNLLRLKWVALSFVPSSLLLGVTTYVTTDIAAMPLFWIAPLALYLLTFVLVFARRSLISHEVVVRIQAILLTFIAVVMLKPGLVPWMGVLGVHLTAFFITALVCHGELVRCRPSTSHLTEFYLWMSLGGMLGGIFNALLAPTLFSSLLEYPLMLIVACLLRPPLAASCARQRVFDLAAPAIYAVALSLAVWGIASIGKDLSAWRTVGLIALLLAAGLVTIGFSDRRVRFALGIAATLASVPILKSLGALPDPQIGAVALSERSFFGMHKVYKDTEHGFSVLMHGTTIHGAQALDANKALQPVSYYHSGGPFANLFTALQLGQQPVAIVGLGAGGLACYGNRGSSWTYYEIDPLVEKIARDERYFTFVRDCPPHVQVVIGDARLTLRDAPDSSYGLILVDAFSSDAIPTHLITREAIAGYLRKLAPNGVLALHISNRHVDLAPVVGNLAADAGLTGRLSDFPAPDVHGNIAQAAAAQLAVLARRESDLGGIASSKLWKALPQQPSARVWSDDYINILAALRLLQ